MHRPITEDSWVWTYSYTDLYPTPLVALILKRRYLDFAIVNKIWKYILQKPYWAWESVHCQTQTMAPTKRKVSNRIRQIRTFSGVRGWTGYWPIWCLSDVKQRSMRQADPYLELFVMSVRDSFTNDSVCDSLWSHKMRCLKKHHGLSLWYFQTVRWTLTEHYMCNIWVNLKHGMSSSYEFTYLGENDSSWVDVHLNHFSHSQSRYTRLRMSNSLK